MIVVIVVIKKNTKKQPNSNWLTENDFNGSCTYFFTKPMRGGAPIYELGASRQRGGQRSKNLKINNKKYKLFRNGHKK